MLVRFRLLLALVAPFALVAACGDSHPAATDDASTPSLDGGLDAGSTEEDDASTPAPDATTDVDAATPCTPGATETVPCGRCGTTDRFCTIEGEWSYGECEAEGACMPGEERSAPCGNCGASTEVCSDTCEWGAPSACEGQGECAPGERTRVSTGCEPGGTREAECSAACVLEPIGECSAADPCTTPGLTESVRCGTRCGTADRFCTVDRHWIYDECVEAGECVPGSMDTVPCARCGTQTRRCDDACGWVDVGVCADQGECTPGETQYTSDGCALGERRLLTCDAACTFDAGACVPGVTDLLTGLGGPAGFGEGTVPVADDNSSPSLDITAVFPSGLNYYGQTYFVLFVNNNGNISFGAPLSTYTPAFPRLTPGPPVIAVWWGDVDTRGGGRPATNNVHWHLDGTRFVATWHEVGYYNSRIDRRNSFQVVLTDRSDVAPGDFDVELRYARCEWTTGDASGGVDGLGGTPANVGFEAGNTVDLLALPGSGTAAVLDLCDSSNGAGPLGTWRYEVRGGIPTQ